MEAELADGRSVTITVRQHPRYRNLRLSVRAGRVHLSAPLRASRATLSGFVKQQLPWLQTHLPLPATAATSFPTSLELKALGETWFVEYSAGGTRITAREDLLRLPAAEGPEAVQQLKRWLATRARQELGRELAEISEWTGLPYGKLSIRGQTSRWGSYSARGDVSLNWKLLFLPPELARYVLLHELCHSRHLNHSRAYWATVASFEPRLAELRLAMRSAESHLPDWLKHGALPVG